MAAASLAVLVLCPLACVPRERFEPPSPYASDEMQAIIEDDNGSRPFLADKGVLFTLYPSAGGGELVIHAVSDLDIERPALAMVFDLADPALPGTVDLARHTVLLMELDTDGQAQLVLDGIPDGSAEVHGVLEPGREIQGSFGLTLDGTNEIGEEMVARIDGTFSGVITLPPTD
jgi:hypothetical protein